MDKDKIVVVTKKTDLERLLQRHATTSQARFHLESRGESFENYLNAHKTYQQGMRQSIASIPSTYKRQVIDKDLLSTYQFSERDIVVVIGDPGLFVNAAKYVGEQPVIVVNPDQKRFADVFTTCYPQELTKTIFEYELGKTRVEGLTMVEAKLDDGQKMLGLNDLFVGYQTHASARYTIKHRNEEERQSSSGVVVATGTGSTAWMRSIVEGACKIAQEYCREGEEREEIPETDFSRSRKEIRYFVREAFPTPITSNNITCGTVYEGEELQINSHMSSGGVIFSDGIEEDYIEFNAGSTVTIQPARHQVQLVQR